MARNRYAVGNSFLNSFMQGYSFVDNIHARKRQEARLEEELERRRARQDAADARQDTVFRQGQQDRASRLRNEQRMREVSALLADPNVSDAELEQYADIPEVSAFLSGRRTDAQTRSDLETVFTRPQAAPAAAAGAPVGQPAPAPGGLAAGVQAAALPGNQPRPTITQAEIQERSFTNPAEATAIRDQQAAERAEEQEAAQATIAERRQARAAGLRPGEAPTTRTQREKAGDLNQQMWAAFADANDVAGDQMRQLPSGTLVNQYHQERQDIRDPQVRADSDRRMRPHITETINSTREVLATPDLDPNSLDARRATRRLQNAMGLAQELNVSYQPLRAVGVDGRGLPLNGANPALTNNVVQSAIEGPGTPAPQSPARTRADMTIVNRGTRGKRLSERQAQAAFRLFKGNILPLEAYQHYMETGQLPSSQPEVKFEQFDPEKPVYANINGQLRMVLPPTKISEEELKRGRNLFDDEGLAQLNKWASAFDTKDDPQAGTRMVQAFIQAASFNEQAIANRGMRLNNVNDVSRLWRHWADLHVIRDAYNDEVWADGRFNPDFNQVYGDMSQVFMDPKFNQEFADERNLRVAGSTTAGMGGDELVLAPQPQRDPRVYQAIREQAPEFANATDQEIDAALVEQGL